MILKDLQLLSDVLFLLPLVVGRVLLQLLYCSFKCAFHPEGPIFQPPMPKASASAYFFRFLFHYCSRDVYYPAFCFFVLARYASLSSSDLTNPCFWFGAEEASECAPTVETLLMAFFLKKNAFSASASVSGVHLKPGTGAT